MKENYILFDLHQDLPTSDSSNLNYLYKQMLPHKSISAFWTTRLKNEPIKYITAYIKKYPPTDNRLFGIEDLWFVDNEYILQEICSLPIVYASLTWNDENNLGGEAGSGKGLTAWGKCVAKTLSKNNILVDTAHLSEKAFFDTCNIEGIKIINSHTCQKSIFEHDRNITDEQIKLIIANDGIIGLTPVSFFMKNDTANIVTIDDFTYQIDTFCQKFDINNIGIGTDFYGAPPLSCLTNYSEFSYLAYKLKSMGYKKIDIDKIFYLNAEKILALNIM